MNVLGTRVLLWSAFEVHYTQSPRKSTERLCEDETYPLAPASGNWWKGTVRKLRPHTYYNGADLEGQLVLKKCGKQEDERDNCLSKGMGYLFAGCKWLSCARLSVKQNSRRVSAWLPLFRLVIFCLLFSLLKHSGFKAAVSSWLKVHVSNVLKTLLLRAVIHSS